MIKQYKISVPKSTLNNIYKKVKKYPWKDKKSIACFRGQYAHQTWKLGEYTKVKAESWNEVNRGYLHGVCQKRKDLFDVGFHKIGKNDTGEKIPTVDGISFIGSIASMFD
mgnify:CR=1 FL=1